MRPRVSVLMPMRNAAPYVRDAIASVLGQDFRALELIVVDDGSTDGSRELVERVGDSRLRIVPGPRRGFAAAWNTALTAARGDVVIECDADDLITPGRIAPQVRLLDERPEFGAVCGGFCSMDAGGRTVAEFGTSEHEEITDELLAGHTRTHLCAFAVRTHLALALGGLREFFESGCDIDFQMRLAERARVWYEPGQTYRYRLHDSSITHTQGSARRQFFEQYARELRTQRASGELDDLQRGCPRTPPARETPEGSRSHIRGMLLGQAWRQHARGDRLAALSSGFRALALAPMNGATWRSVVALLVKTPPGPK